MKIFSTLLKYIYALIVMVSFNMKAAEETENMWADGFISLGLMSGTSMDGIDAALIRTNGEFEVEDLGHDFLPYSTHFHRLLKAASFRRSQAWRGYESCS